MSTPEWEQSDEELVVGLDDDEEEDVGLIGGGGPAAAMDDLQDPDEAEPHSADTDAQELG